MIIRETQIRVRYSETDKMGYLYYGNYPAYYEVGRAEWLRSFGVTYRDMEEVHGIMMPVMSMQMRYVRPAKYDDLLTITTTLRHYPTNSITFFFEIFNAQNKLLNGGSVKLCFVEIATNKTVPVPNYISVQLKPFFKE